MRRTKFFLLSGMCTLFFAVAANAQDINQAIEFNNKGAEAVQSKNWAVAIEQYAQALAIAQELGEDGADMVENIKGLIPSLHLFLGQELAKDAKINEAMAELNKAIETAKKYDDPGTTAADAKKLIDQINVSTATNLLNDKKYSEAIDACKVVLEADPNNGAMYLYIGMAYQALNNEAEAIAAFEKAIALGQTAAAQRLSNIYLSQAQAAQRANPPKWTAVYDLSKKALAIFESVNANLTFGSAALETKKYQEAITALDKVLSSNPNEQTKSNVIYRLARAYEGLGKTAQACGFYKQLLNDTNASIKNFAEAKVKELKCP